MWYSHEGEFDEAQATQGAVKRVHHVFPPRRIAKTLSGIAPKHDPFRLQMQKNE